MQSGDVAAVMSIQSVCLEIAQWTERDYMRVSEAGMAGWVAEEKGAVAGFIVARRVASELEVLNLAVEPSARRRGVGAALLREALEWGATLGVEKTFLEVRVSNLAAIRFYGRNGFEVSRRRPRYYTAPIEDALVLTSTASGEMMRRTGVR
jgi:[ribosomal protein S18]-alanine N-acetyltransferase